MSWMRQTIVCFFLLSVLLPMGANAEQNRLALVIGNSGYASSALRNPKNDANDMAKVLDTLGFDVTLALDLDGLNMERTIREFGKRLERHKGIGFFYYAGHGVQVDGNNYLIPIDSTIEDEDEIRFKSIAVESVLSKMQRANDGLNILVLDACRNNPFPSAVRSGNRGLARLDAPTGSIVVYSTSPGSVSEDGTGRNGTFTGHFINFLKQPGLTLTQTIRRTRKAVRAATNNKQNPWASSNLVEDEYVLLPNASGAGLASATESSSPIDVEKLFWQSVTAGNSLDEYAAYIATYPDGLFTNLAQSRIRALQIKAEQQVASNAKTSAVPKTQADNGSTISDNLVAMIPNDASGAATSGTLSINTTPADARIRIMNIVEKYRPGITLEKNREYDIYVQRQGYKAWRERVFIDEFTNNIDVKLEKINTIVDQAQAVLPSPAEVPTQTPEQAVPVQPKVFAQGDRAWQRMQADQFIMGCSDGDKLCTKVEKPVKNVHVRAFQISATEVTVGEFRAFVTATNYKTDAETNAGGYTGCFIRAEKAGISRDNARWAWVRGANWSAPGFEQNDSHPVTCISWNDAVAYTQWLSKTSGDNVRLPTEAEWEYAVRAGSTKRFGQSSSSRNLCTFENGADKTKSSTGASWTEKLKCTDGYWNTAPVGSFTANAFGMYDMLGNVREWTLDVWQNQLPKQDISNQPNVAGPDEERVLRGGAWDAAASKLRVSSRTRGYKDSRASMTGFRIVRETSAQAAK